jgi:hypothetical protein
MPSCSARRSIYKFKPQYRRDYIVVFRGRVAITLKLLPQKRWPSKASNDLFQSGRRKP